MFKEVKLSIYWTTQMKATSIPGSKFHLPLVLVSSDQISISKKYSANFLCVIASIILTEHRQNIVKNIYFGDFMRFTCTTG